MRREDTRQAEAFETWYSNDQSFQSVADQYSVSRGAVVKWARWFNWRERAEERDAEARRRVDREAAQRKAKMLTDHQKAGALLRARGVQFFQANEIKEAQHAIAAVKQGIEIERVTAELPSFVVAVLEMTEDELRAEQRRLHRDMQALALGEPETGADRSGEALPEWEGEEPGGEPA